MLCGVDFVLLQCGKNTESCFGTGIRWKGAAHSRAWPWAVDTRGTDAVQKGLSPSKALWLTIPGSHVSAPLCFIFLVLSPDPGSIKRIWGIVKAHFRVKPYNDGANHCLSLSHTTMQSWTTRTKIIPSRNPWDVVSRESRSKTFRPPLIVCMSHLCRQISGVGSRWQQEWGVALGYGIRLEWCKWKRQRHLVPHLTEVTS